MYVPYRQNAHYETIAPPHPSPGFRLCQSVACWNMWAPRSNRSSSKGGAWRCKPIGSPAELNPQGIDKAPMPARFVLTV